MRQWGDGTDGEVRLGYAHKETLAGLTESPDTRNAPSEVSRLTQGVTPLNACDVGEDRGLDAADWEGDLALQHITTSVPSMPSASGIRLLDTAQPTVGTGLPGFTCTAFPGEAYGQCLEAQRIRPALQLSPCEVQAAGTGPAAALALTGVPPHIFHL